MSLYIFWIYNIYHLCCTCIDFYDLSARGGVWFVVCIRFIYKFLNVCPFNCTAVAGSGKTGPINRRLNYTIVITRCLSSVRPPSVVNFSHLFSTSPLKPLKLIQRNLTGSKKSTSSTKFLFFGPVGKTRWPPWTLIG